MLAPPGRSVQSMCQSDELADHAVSRSLMPYNFLAQSTRARAPGLHSEFQNDSTPHLGQILPTDVCYIQTLNAACNDFCHEYHGRQFAELIPND